MKPVSRVLLLSHASGVVSLAGVQGVVPALPVIQDALGISESQAALLMSAYLLPSVIFAIPAGLLADRFGRRGLFVGSMMLFGLSGAAALLVNTFSELLVLRMFQGAAFAAILLLSLTILGDTVSGRTQVSQQGVRAVLIASGDMLWALIGGGLALVYWSAPLAGSAVALPLALLGWKWLDGAPAKAFEPVEASKAPAAVRLMFSAFKTRIGLSVQFAGFARFLFKYALFTLVPLLLFQRGFSTLFISSVLAASAATAMASAAASPLGLRVVRASTLLAYVLLAFAAAFALVSVTKNPATIVVAMMVFGLAEGAFSVISNAMLLQSVGTQQRATVVGTAGAIKNLAKFLAPTALSVLLVWASLETAFLVTAALALAAIPVTLPLRPLDHRLNASVGQNA